MIINRLVHKIRETKWKYKFSHSNVRVKGTLNIHKNVVIKKTSIFIDATSSVELCDNVRLDGISLYAVNGAKVVIGDFSFLEKAANATIPMYEINNGELIVAHHTRLRCQRLWIRFGGKASIGCYTNINEGSELRADESIVVGNYCQISYNTRIWDTNTHCIYPPERRKKIAREYFPYFGYENERPKTKPIIIKDGCWLGEKVSLLKGVELGENVIVGYNTMLLHMKIDDNCTVVQNIDLDIKSTNYAVRIP